MDVERIHAFLKGYARHFELTLPNIADALRLACQYGSLGGIGEVYGTGAA